MTNIELAKALIEDIEQAGIREVMITDISERWNFEIEGVTPLQEALGIEMKFFLNQSIHCKMNRSEAKELLPIIQAFAEGKEIEFRSKGFDEEWRELKQIPGLSYDSFEYRIKPEPKYRPFKDADECWQEMLKHQPFGWLKHKDDNEFRCILKITDSRISMIDICEEVAFYDCNETFKQYTFADGTPFGVKEEEV